MAGAEQEYKRALEMDPKFGAAHANLVAAARARGTGPPQRDIISKRRQGRKKPLQPTGALLQLIPFAG